MLIVVKVKDTDNIIGLKEDIAARLEDMVDIERIGVYENSEIRKAKHGKWINTGKYSCGGILFACSECQNEELIGDFNATRYCPKCGTDMMPRKDGTP